MVFPTYSIDFFIFFVGSYLFSLSGAGMDNGLLQGISISFFCLTNIGLCSQSVGHFFGLYCSKHLNQQHFKYKMMP